MAKKVLNKSHREVLERHASQLVNQTEDRTALDAAYEAAAAMVAGLVEKRYPKADMDVLKKYDLGRTDSCIYVSPGYGGYERFDFNVTDTRIPRVPERWCNTRQPHLMDEAEAAIFDAWKSARDAYRRSVDKRMSDFKALISVSRTFEDVEEVWPAAGALREKICGKNTAIATINDEVIARLKADAAANTELPA